MASGISDSKIHAKINSKVSSRKQRVWSATRCQMSSCRCHCGSPAEATACILGYIDIRLCVARGSPTEDLYLSADLYCRLALG